MLVAFIGALTLQAQSPERPQLQKRDRTEYRMHKKQDGDYRMHKKQDGEHRQGKFAERKGKRSEMKEYRKMKRMAMADGKVTPREKKMLRKERRQKRPR